MIFALLLGSFIQLPVTIVQPNSGLRVQQCSVKSTLPQTALVPSPIRKYVRNQKRFRSSKLYYDIIVHNALNLAVSQLRMELDPYVLIRGREQFAGPTTQVVFKTTIQSNTSARLFYESQSYENFFAYYGKRITKVKCFPVEAKLADGKTITFFRRNVFF